MRQLIIVSLLGQFIFYSCNPEKRDSKNPASNESRESTIIEIEEINSTPTVDLAKYKLIVDSGKGRKLDAEQILRVKRKWPLAMQSKNPAEFDSILSKNFIFPGRNSFYNRNDYIKDRTSQGEWIVTFVKYENVTLQFIEEKAIMSYVNHVTNKSKKTGNIEYEHMSWIDIYILEDGKWKIEAAFPIDYRLEIPAK